MCGGVVWGWGDWSGCVDPPQGPQDPPEQQQLLGFQSPQLPELPTAQHDPGCLRPGATCATCCRLTLAQHEPECLQAALGCSGCHSGPLTGTACGTRPGPAFIGSMCCWTRPVLWRQDSAWHDACSLQVVPGLGDSPSGLVLTKGAWLHAKLGQACDKWHRWC